MRVRQPLPVNQQPQQPPFVNSTVVAAGQSLCIRSVESRARCAPRCSLAGCGGDCKLLGMQEQQHTCTALASSSPHHLEAPCCVVSPRVGNTASEVSDPFHQELHATLPASAPTADASQASFQWLRRSRGGSHVSAGWAVGWEKPALTLWSELVASHAQSPVVSL